MILFKRQLIVFFYIAMLFPLSSVCQLNDSLFKRLSIGINYEPGIHYRQLNYSVSSRWVKAVRNEEEIPSYGFATGLNFKYRLNKKFTLECGFLYAAKGIKTKKKVLIWDMPNDQYPVKSQTKFSFSHLDIPLKLNYNFHIRKTLFYISTGFSLNNFINKKTSITAYFSDGDKTKTTHKQDFDYQSDSYAVILGLGCSIPLSARLLLYIEPVYRQGITSITKNKNAKEYLYSAGINTQLFYHFKKRMN